MKCKGKKQYPIKQSLPSANPSMYSHVNQIKTAVSYLEYNSMTINFQTLLENMIRYKGRKTWMKLDI